MGYVRNVVYRLRFADESGQFEGLVVRARSVAMGQLIELTRLADLPTDALRADGMQALKDLCSGFAKALVSWNVEEMVDPDADPDDAAAERRPVPHTEAGLMSQDLDFVLAIVMTWIETIAGAATPLAKRSSAGETSVAAQIPMVPLSESQAS